MTNDPFVLAYLAGAIDADGYITVQRSLRKIGKRYQHYPTYFHPKIGYTSTSPIVPTLLKETFGGGVHQYQPKNPDHRLTLMWSIATAAAGVSARALIPYLRQKRRQAELLVELCKLISAQRAEQQLTQKPPYRITPDQLAEREKFWQAVTELNEPRNRRVHPVVKSRAGRLLDGREWNEFPEVGQCR